MDGDSGDSNRTTSPTHHSDRVHALGPSSDGDRPDVAGSSATTADLRRPGGAASLSPDVDASGAAAAAAALPLQTGVRSGIGLETVGGAEYERVGRRDPSGMLLTSGPLDEDSYPERWDARSNICTQSR